MSAYEQWIAFLTIMRKEVRRYLRIWTQTLLPSAITMSLYFLIFGTLIGKRIGTMGGVSYMEFVVPGLIMMAIITNTYANVVGSFFGAKFNNSIEELLVSPTPNYVIVLGYVAGGVSRGILVSIIVTSVALFFTKLDIYNWFVVISVVALTSVAFSLCGLINAVFANTFDDVNIVPTFVLTPLTYLGGVFYSLDLLPDFWAGVSQINPLVYVVNAFRYGVLGVSDVDITVSFTMLIGLTVVAFALCDAFVEHRHTFANLSYGGCSWTNRRRAWRIHSQRSRAHRSSIGPRRHQKPV
jgi:ABC-2 type transport system permease protein